MTGRAGRAKTLRGVALALTLVFLAGVLSLVVEFSAVGRGDASTISELVWSAWAAQPGAFLAVLLPLTFASGWLGGHFAWQSRVVYDAAREGIDLDAALDLAIEARAAYRLQKRTGNGREPLTVMLSPTFVEALDGAEES